jgi:hypothetical protein
VSEARQRRAGVASRNPEQSEGPAEVETLADPERLELPTSAFEAHCSIQLSYGSALNPPSLAGLETNDSDR